MGEGFMPRPIKYSKEKILELIRVKEEEGIPIKRQCREQDLKYVSVNRAMRRYNLLNPLKFARREGRAENGKVTEAQVALTKNQQRKLQEAKQTEASV